MVKVYSAQFIVLIENMKNVLKMHNIESYVTNQYLSSVSGEIPPYETWPQLWVAEQDVAQAREIIRETEKESPESQEILICPKCGEEVEGQFTECWNCGAPVQ